MSNYQEYIPNFFPRLRDQARRFSESSPSLSPFPLPPFPQLPDFSAWTARYWNNSSPPLESGEATGNESTVQALARTIQLWTQQLNSDPFSPPLEPISDEAPPAQDASTTEFPPLETEIAPAPPPRLEDVRANSETSLNPARRLQNRSRVFDNREHSQSDPLAAVNFTQTPPAAQDQESADVYMEDGYVRRRDGSDALPEDDGMGPLRQRINAIWTGSGTPLEKSKLIHVLMNERHRALQKSKPGASRSRSGTITQLQNSMLTTEHSAFRLSKQDLTPTFAPLNEDEIEAGLTESQRSLGCVHYRRNVKMQCFTCNKWYTCRLCHDATESHILPRRETKFMLCMLCETPQAVSQSCTSCGEQAAYYYCAICKLWNNDPRKSIYHCNECGLCRLGQGLGKDFFHCKTCAACMSIQFQDTHRCIEHSTKCDCPICGEYLFTSSSPVMFMKCGHSIHNSCFRELCEITYKCPICSKSVENMASQFQRLERHIQTQPMPAEYRDKKAYIFCNDCLNKGASTYHWLGTKCIFCDSYNTVQLEMVGEAPTVQLQMQEEAQNHVSDAGMAESSMTLSQTQAPVDDLNQSPTYPEQPPPRHAAPSQTRPASRQVPTPMIATSPTVHSPWLMPHSPSSRSARSASPAVSSYFGTGEQSQRSSTPTTTASAAMSAAAGMAAAAGAEFARRISSVGRATPNEDAEDEDMDFWGGHSPRSHESVLDEQGSNEDDDDDSSDDTDQAMDEDDNENDDGDDDAMDVFGHR